MDINLMTAINMLAIYVVATFVVGGLIMYGVRKLLNYGVSEEEEA